MAIGADGGPPDSDQAGGNIVHGNLEGSQWFGVWREFGRNRRTALLKALENAGNHGLPTDSYGLDALKDRLRGINSQRELGWAEVELSLVFLRYARALQSGVLEPHRVDPHIHRTVPVRGAGSLLTAFSGTAPDAFLRALPPSSAEYVRLLKAKMILHQHLE